MLPNVVIHNLLAFNIRFSLEYNQAGIFVDNVELTLFGREKDEMNQKAQLE